MNLFCKYLISVSEMNKKTPFCVVYPVLVAGWLVELYPVSSAVFRARMAFRGPKETRDQRVTGAAG